MVLSPFSLVKDDTERGLDYSSLPFVGIVGEGEDQYLSHWKVKPTGKYDQDLRIGRSYAMDALRMARVEGKPRGLKLSLESFPKQKK
jgi:hypothetical protein